MLKFWDKVERLCSLFVYEKGIVVEMKGKGVGEVVDVNLQLQMFKVDFEMIKGMFVGFWVVGKMLMVFNFEYIFYCKYMILDEFESMELVEFF